jgi:predicted TIM-barrel fold metal-dependent hydrolase
MSSLNQFKVFDSHFHIIDKGFPLVVNQGYLPDYFSASDYRHRTQHYDIGGGAIVSGSFQGFDQSYLLAALKNLGPNFVGVAQLPTTVSDAELLSLNSAGVRAIRFNLIRCDHTENQDLAYFARRVHEIVGWHTEVYVNSKDLPELHQTLIKLPKVCIDHLGLSGSGFANLLSLVEHGVHVKATGFGRVDFDIKPAIKSIMAINPKALIFGTDLPSTRVARAFSDEDLFTVVDAIGEENARKVFYANAISLYRPKADDNSNGTGI